MKAFRKIVMAAAVSAMAIGAAHAADKTKIALVVKSLGNGFFEAAHEGADEAAKKLGDVQVIYTGPTDTTAEGQIQVLNTLIAQHVDAIAISANDKDAVVPTLKKAMQRGIDVISWDSAVAPAGREMHLNPSSNELIGQTLVKLAQQALPDGKGKIAILSASATATNQNTWIAAMKDQLKDHPDIDLVTTVYGDDLSDKSYREAEGLMKSYPDLKAIVAPTSVGIVAAAQAVEDAGKTGQINVTGLGLPSEMAGHVKTGASKSFALWNPIDLGYAATMIAYQLATDKAEAKDGATIDIGRLGSVKLDSDNEGVMGEPFVFNADNIDKYAKMY
ncbi:rhamnose ABC transporter substrate-binding protein [Pararhizobium mangrovi]|uniref:Rhamnose ABC transporter substrate-binding protein n=1 Tax=Pararhizobium mangrovi TaxID=2590452 RepID=A0A506UC63_9HYPH|nr:rhamnose ABC transporter substrate-binding protein [Pararhizobium mangrovi]TPW30249.1 rhamnose ABC transporter substrate-binding protein [Pararhizobium mangrovi]